MNKLFAVLIMTITLSTSAFAKGFYCESTDLDEDGKNYTLEATLQNKSINVLQLNWDIKDDRGHADEYETILADQQADIVESYKPTTTKYQGYSKYKTTTGDYSYQEVEILVPQKLGEAKSKFAGYVKVVDEHAGLIANVLLDCVTTN